MSIRPSNWCWLDARLQTMVEMDPIVTALTTLWSKNKLQSGLGLELFKVLRALQNPGEKHKLFHDILLSDNTINLKPLYDKMIEEKIILTAGTYESSSSTYERLINWLIKQYPEVKEILMKVQFERIFVSNKLATEAVALSMKTFKKEILIGATDFFSSFYRDYFCIRLDLHPQNLNMPKIIDNVPLVKNQGKANYEVAGFVLNRSQSHFVAIVKSKNSQWHFYNGSVVESVPQAKIESLLRTGSYDDGFTLESLVYKKIVTINKPVIKKTIPPESIMQLLQTLKIKLQKLLEQVKVLHSSN